MSQSSVHQTNKFPTDLHRVSEWHRSPTTVPVVATAPDAPDVLRKGDEVICARDLREVPEGTEGKVVLVVGLSWIRYWVRFANGVAVGSVNRRDLATPAEFFEDVLDGQGVVLAGEKIIDGACGEIMAGPLAEGFEFRIVGKDSLPYQSDIGVVRSVACGARSVALPTRAVGGWWGRCVIHRGAQNRVPLAWVLVQVWLGE